MASLVCSDANLYNSGLDIPTVELVLNFDIPRDPTDYIHRVGRTARAGRGGQALSIVSEHDIQLIQNIEAKTSQYQMWHYFYIYFHHY
jgi:superfamily II DNA/RNA helicase